MTLGPTKSQRRRARERRVRQQAHEFDEKMGPMPLHIVEAIAVLGANTEIIRGQDKFERAPLHVVMAGECPSVDRGIMNRLSAQASERRAEPQNDRRNAILKHCRDLLGARGNAAKVRKRLIANIEGAYSIRTIQRDIRHFAEIASPPRLPPNKR